MLWRAGYSTRELSSVEMPPLVARTLSGDPFVVDRPGVLIGGFDLRAQAELGVWRRLFDEVGADLPIWTIYFVGPALHDPLRGMTPGSKWGSTLAAEPCQAWEDLIQADRQERSFAGVFHEGVFDLLMVGTPTEDAWDRFAMQLHISKEL